MTDGPSIDPSSPNAIAVSGGRRYTAAELRRAARHEAGHAVMAIIAAHTERRPDWEPIQVFINPVSHDDLHRGAAVREANIWTGYDLPRTYRYEPIDRQALAEVLRGIEWELLIGLSGIAADIEIGGMRPTRAALGGGMDDYLKAVRVLSDMNALLGSDIKLDWYERRSREIIKREREAVETLASTLLIMGEIVRPSIANIVSPLLRTAVHD